MKDIILNIVESRYAVKAVELALATMEVVNPQRFNHEDYVNTLNELVASGDVIEMQYIAPQLAYRIKSIYFPRGTSFCHEIPKAVRKTSEV